MSIKTQGTDLYAIDPDDGTLIDVGCVTSIDGIDTAIDQIETTCLNGTARTYVAGLATPGTATFTIQTDTADSNHLRLHELKTAGRDIQWAIGWSEQPGLQPTVATDSSGDYEFVLPTGRSWLLFEGYMNAFPFSFAQNSVVTSAVGVQVSGEPVLVAAVIP